MWVVEVQVLVEVRVLGEELRGSNNTAPKNQGAVLGGEQYGYFTEKGIGEIIEQGGKRWTKGGKDRIYIKDMAETVGGLEIDYYKTGRISSAKVNGEEISNSEASRILGVFSNRNPYIDLTNGAIHNLSEHSREVVQSVIGNVEMFIKQRRYKNK